jgi:hypothetical protein
MTDRKKAGAAFWAAVVVALVLIIYPLSFGPYLWFHWRFEIEPVWLDKAADVFFAPAIWLCQKELGPLGDSYNRYCEWWIVLAVSR